METNLFDFIFKIMLHTFRPLLKLRILDIICYLKIRVYHKITALEIKCEDTKVTLRCKFIISVRLVLFRVLLFLFLAAFLS